MNHRGKVRSRIIIPFILVSFIIGYGQPGNWTEQGPIEKPVLHHLLLEIGDLKASIRFYQDFLGLKLRSQSVDFATLESDNAGVYLWQKKWEWEKTSAKGCRNGRGMYPHFGVDDVNASVSRFRLGGYKIIQEPKKYDWGTEAFVQDPDGYIIALVSIGTDSGH